MAHCIYCGADTSLYADNRPVCLHCAEGLDKAGSRTSWNEMQGPLSTPKVCVSTGKGFEGCGVNSPMLVRSARECRRLRSTCGSHRLQVRWSERSRVIDHIGFEPKD